jgi:peptidoglycan/LPS O-acetylase OafA/YrhL
VLWSLGTVQLGAFPPLAVQLIGAVLAISAGLLAYWLLEKPLLSRLRRARARQRALEPVRLPEVG